VKAIRFVAGDPREDLDQLRVVIGGLGRIPLLLVGEEPLELVAEARRVEPQHALGRPPLRDLSSPV